MAGNDGAITVMLECAKCGRTEEAALPEKASEGDMERLVKVI